MSSNSFLKAFLTKGKLIARRFRTIYQTFMLMEDMQDLKKLKRFVNPVVPGIVSPVNEVPSHIIKPYYCSETVKPSGAPVLKFDQDIKAMRSTCQLAKKILFAAEKFIKVGVTTDELDKYIHNLIIKHSAYPSPLNYLGFPKSICTSVNNVAVHGIPDDRKLQNGDIITVDVTVFRDGFHGDCAATFLVGNVAKDTRDLVKVARSALFRAISQCKPGQNLRAIAEAVSMEAFEHNYTVVPSVCGHGIGRDFHEGPEIIHSSYHFEDTATVMLPGMTFTIEPVLSDYGEELIVLEDRWTAVTSSDSLCAQFEHTVLITDNGVEILTE